MNRKLCVFMCIILILNTVTYAAIETANYTPSNSEASVDIGNILPNFDVRVSFDQTLIIDGEGSRVEVRLLLNRPSSEAVSFDFKTMDGSAIQNQNYRPSQGEIIFLPGETEKSISIQLLDLTNADFIGENLFYITFSNIKNGLFAGDVLEKKIKIVLKNGLPMNVTSMMKLQSKNVAKGSSVDVSVTCANMPYTNKSEVLLVASFSDKIINSGVIKMTVNGVTLYPEEVNGTVSQRLTFVYSLRDRDLMDASSEIVLNIEDVKNVGILSNQKIYDKVNIKTEKIILQMNKAVESYLHDLKLTLSYDEDKNSIGHLTLDVHNFNAVLKDLMNKVYNRNDSALYFDKLYFQLIGPTGQIQSIDTFYQDTNAYQLFGDFTLPVNNSGMVQKYVVCVVSEGQILPNIYTYFEVMPVVRIDDSTDMQILYTDWPPNDKTKIKEGIYRQLNYWIREDATWKGSDDLIWSSSNPEVASIDSNGRIEIKKDGMVKFILTALNDGQNESRFSLSTPTLTIRELQKPYITLVDKDLNIQSKVHEDLTIFLGSNLTEHNFDAGFGDQTIFTISLYAVEYASNHKEKRTLVYKYQVPSLVDQPIADVTIKGEWLNQVAPLGVANYAITVEAEEIEKGKLYVDTAYIEVKNPSSHVRFDPLETLYFDDEKGLIELPWKMTDLDIQNNNIESKFEVQLVGTQDLFYTQSGFAATNGLALFEPRKVPEGVIREAYHVTIMVRNNPDEPWSKDTQTLYVYNHDALIPTVDGLPSENLYMSNIEGIREMDVKQILNLQRDIKLRADLSTNVINYALFGPDNHFTWNLDHKDVVSLRDQNLIDWIMLKTEYSSEDHFYLFGDADGISTIEAKHIYSSLTGRMVVEVDNLKDQLYLFDNVQGFPYTIQYINGDGKTVKTSSAQVFDGDTAIFEEKGIASDVVISYIQGEELYRKVIKQDNLLSGEGSGAIKSVYPVNTFEMTTVNSASLLLLDEGGNPYTGTIQLLGGVYVQDIYQPEMLINGQGRYAPQTLSVVDGKLNIKIDPIRLEAVKYTNQIEVKLQIRDANQDYYPIFDFFGGTDVQSFSKETHPLKFMPYLLNREDHSVFDEYQIINQTYQYSNGVKNSITDAVDYIYVDKLGQVVSIYSQILIPKVTNDQSVSISAYVIDKNQVKIDLDQVSLKLYDGNYPFSDLQIYDFEYAYSENSFETMKIGSGEHYPVHINVKIEKPVVEDVTASDVTISHTLNYQLLNLNGVATVGETYKNIATDYYEELKSYVDFSSYVDNLGVDGQVKDLIRTIAFGNAAPASNRVAFVIEPGDGLLKYQAVLAFVLDDKTDILKDYGIGTYFFDLLSPTNSRPLTSAWSLTNTLDNIIENYKPMNNTLKEGDPNFKVEGYGYITYEIYYDVNAKSWKSDLINYNTTLSGAMKKQKTQTYFKKSYDFGVVEPELAVTGTTTLSALINYRGALKPHVNPLYAFAILYSPSIAGTISYTAYSKIAVDEIADAGLSGGVTGTATVGYTHRFYESDDPVINDKNSGELKVVGTIKAFFNAWAPLVDYEDDWELYKLTFGPYHFPNFSAWSSQYTNYMNAISSAVKMQRLLIAGSDEKASTVKDTLISNSAFPNQNIKIASVKENGVDRFVVGYKVLDVQGLSRINLHLFDENGVEIVNRFHQIKGDAIEDFSFSENASELDSLYIIWHSVETRYLENQVTASINDVMYASRYVFDGEWGLSYPMILGQLKTDSYFDSFTATSLGDALRVNYEAKVVTESASFMESGEMTGKLNDAIEVTHVNLNSNEIFDNHEMPFEFNILNKGYRAMDNVDVLIGGKNYHIQLERPLKPGEMTSLVINHRLDNMSQELDFEITATFSGEKTVVLGQINLEIYDLQLGTIELLKAFENERIFNFKISSESKRKMLEGEDVVVLGIYSDMFDLSKPVKEVTIRDQASLDEMMKGNFSQNLTLKEELLPYLSPEGEIPIEQISYYVVVSLVHKDEMPQIMDRKMLKVKSLLERSNGVKFTHDAIIRHGSQSIIDLKLTNNSLNAYNGKIMVQLYDHDNHLVGTLPIAPEKGAININGESTSYFSVKTNLAFNTIKLIWAEQINQ